MADVSASLRSASALPDRPVVRFRRWRIPAEPSALALETTRARIVGSAFEDQLKPLRAQTLDLIDRNLVRSSGQVADGVERLTW